VVTPPYLGFLTASTAASAALIGLLFVAVSIAPERIFGARSEGEHQARALSAFTALVNVFFISFAGLVPDLNLGTIVLPAALLSLAQTAYLLYEFPKWRRERRLLRAVALVLVSALIYVSELRAGQQLWTAPHNTAALTGLLITLLGAYAIGLTRSWELLGAPTGRGPISHLFGRLGRRRTEKS
jgi:hypothetical protein